MHPILSITLFISYVSALDVQPLDLQPLVTPAPQVEIRDVGAPQSICGYYTDHNTIATLGCSTGTPCLVAQTLSPAVLHCSGVSPNTVAYPYPSTGCGTGQRCCPASAPSPVKYWFNGGQTVGLGCSTASSTYIAFFSSLTPVADNQPTSTTSTPITPSTTSSSTTSSSTTSSSTTSSSTTSSSTTSPSNTGSAQAPPPVTVVAQPASTQKGSGTANKAAINMMFAAVIIALTGI